MHSIDETIVFRPSSLIQRYLLNAESVGIHRQRPVIEFIFRNYLSFNIYEDDLEDCIDQFIEITELFYNKYKANVSLGFRKVDDRTLFEPFFKVIYPEIVITNSNRKSHTIKDLIVVHTFSYSNSKLYPLRPLGTRGKLTLKEEAAGYLHSHLPSKSDWVDEPLRLGTFCIGNDTDVSRMLAEIECTEWDINRYELYLFCVDTMMHWESLEGVPHIRMENVDNALSKRVLSFSSSLGDKLVDKILHHKIPLNVDFYVDEGRYKIAVNEKSNLFIKEQILKFIHLDRRSILVTRVPNKYENYLEMPLNVSREARPKNFTSKYTKFGNTKYYPSRILDAPQKRIVENDLDNFIVYPKFLNYVLRELEYQIYKAAITKSAANLLSQGDNARNGAESDTVSVQVNF